jgi:capsular polysaccharide biosynthesis protein
VILEKLSIKEQRLLFSEAEAIFAAHGAGLSNLVYCMPGTKIIEIFSSQYVPLYYWNLANQVNLQYFYLIGKGGKISSKNLKSENIYIDLDKVSRLLKKVL